MVQLLLLIFTGLLVFLTYKMVYGGKMIEEKNKHWDKVSKCKDGKEHKWSDWTDEKKQKRHCTKCKIKDAL